MRITISKETTEANMVRQVHSAIQMAKDCAKNGITSFKFSVRTDSGFNKHELVRRVARVTENTVYAAGAWNLGHAVIFYIRQE